MYFLIPTKLHSVYLLQGVTGFEVEGENKARGVCQRLGEPRGMATWKTFVN